MATSAASRSIDSRPASLPCQPLDDELTELAREVDVYLAFWAYARKDASNHHGEDES